MGPCFGSEMSEHDVTVTSFSADLEELQDFSFVKICKIDKQEGHESFVTILPSVRELS